MISERADFPRAFKIFFSDVFTDWTALCSDVWHDSSICWDESTSHLAEGLIHSEMGYILLSRVKLVHSPLPSTGERIKEALHCSEWQLMVHVAGEMGVMRGPPGVKGETQQVCMCVAWWTHKLLQYVYIYSHMDVCAWVWMVAAVLYRLTNMHLWANSWRDFLSLQSRTLLPRLLKLLRDGRVAEGISSLLPICSFSQQLKSLRNAAITSNLSQRNCGGTGWESESKGNCRNLHLHFGWWGWWWRVKLHSYTLLPSINRSISDPQSEATGHEPINILQRQTDLCRALSEDFKQWGN